MTTTPATRIRRARTTARAIARAAARHGLPSQCAELGLDAELIRDAA